MCKKRRVVSGELINSYEKSQIFSTLEKPSIAIDHRILCITNKQKRNIPTHILIVVVVNFTP